MPKVEEKGMKKNNQKGMALVSMLIIIALLSILAGSLMQLSYMAYARKMVERRNTETFYTAESSIDTIKSVLQNRVADKISSVENGKQEFAQEVFKLLFPNSADDLSVNSEATEFDVKALRDFLYERIIKDYNGNKKTDKEYYKGYKDGEDFTTVEWGIDPENGGEFTIGGAVLEDEAVRIKDVHIKYVNKHGYVAEITTDILINAPKWAKKEMDKQPMGTYSMFAGNGMSIESSSGGIADNSGHSDLGNMTYLHQEGNVYVGQMDSTVNSLVIGDKNKPGAVLASFGGTNCVFNGNIVVNDGSTLVFTGGDGSQDAQVQVNGYIKLLGGSTLLLAPNVKIKCKGILNSDDIEDIYTGAGNDSVTLGGGYGSVDLSTVSQFYPCSQSYIDAFEDKTATAKMRDRYYDFLNYDVDVCYVLQAIKNNKMPDIKWNNSTEQSKWEMDARMVSVITKGNHSSGVYILDVDTEGGRWKHTSGDEGYNEYKLVDNSTGQWLWKNESVYGDNKNIYIPAKNSPDYEELDQELKVTYKGTDYDREFAKLINVQLLDHYTQANDPVTNTYYPSYRYDLTNKSYIIEDTYETIPWINDEGKLLDGKFGDYTIEQAIAAYDDVSKETAGFPDVLKNFDWEGIYEDLDSIYKRQLKVLDTTKLTAEQNQLTPSSFKFVTENYSKNASDNNTLEFSLSDFRVGMANGGNLPVNMYDTNVVLAFTPNDITFHAYGGTYAGLFMASQRVKIGESSAISRGVSLIELAKKTVAQDIDGDGVTVETAKLTNKNNPVRIMLEVLAGGWMDKNPSNPGFDGDAISLNVVDNLFSGGVDVFWTSFETIEDSSSGSATKEDSGDLISVDKWKKD